MREIFGWKVLFKWDKYLVGKYCLNESCSVLVSTLYFYSKGSSSTGIFDPKYFHGEDCLDAM